MVVGTTLERTLIPRPSTITSNFLLPLPSSSSSSSNSRSKAMLLREEERGRRGNAPTLQRRAIRTRDRTLSVT